MMVLQRRSKPEYRSQVYRDQKVMQMENAVNASANLFGQQVRAERVSENSNSAQRKNCHGLLAAPPANVC